MPPKKKAKTVSTTATNATNASDTTNTATTPSSARASSSSHPKRATRASTRNKSGTSATTADPDTPTSSGSSATITATSITATITTTSGKRKRGALVRPIVTDPDTSDVELVPVRAAMKAKSKAATAPLKKKTAAATMPRVNYVRRWFDTYANQETDTIDPSTFQKWMDDLEVSSEGAFMYFILWKCNAATQMSIAFDEFKSFMDGIGAKSNEQLMNQLPGLMATVRPTKARPAMPGCADQFRPFYKWCFNHFKPDGQKNVPVDIATVLFQTLLDADKYSPSWQPSTTAANGDYVRGCTPGEFPHVNAFVEFLNSEPKPVQVITRDQYEQFYEFNSSVGWDLREHSEDSAWPALVDSYVAWKRENFPSPADTVRDR